MYNYNYCPLLEGKLCNIERVLGSRVLFEQSAPNDLLQGTLLKTGKLRRKSQNDEEMLKIRDGTKFTTKYKPPFVRNFPKFKFRAKT
eukprot:2865811-Amphidinium_carterae.1